MAKVTKGPKRFIDAKPDKKCKACKGRGIVIHKGKIVKDYLIAKYGRHDAKLMNYQYEDLCECVEKQL